MLKDTINSVLAGEQVPTEIVVVDQSDLACLDFHDGLSHGNCTIRCIPTTARGVSRARNVGIVAATHDVLVFADDDMFAAPTWFGTLVGALVAAGSGVTVTGRVLPGVEEIAGGWVPSTVISEQPAEYRGRIDKDVLAGGHMAIYRQPLVEMGCFDERLGGGSAFPAAEDNDLGYRLLTAGYGIVYVPEAVLYHRAWRPAHDYLRVRWSYGKGKAGYYCKHIGDGDWSMLRRMANDVGRRLVSFPNRALHEPHRALGDLSYITGMMFGICLWVGTQRVRRP